MVANRANRSISQARKEKKRQAMAERFGGAVATLGGDYSEDEEQSPDRGDQDYSEDEEEGEEEEEGRSAKRFKSDNLQDTEDLARQLLGDL